MSAPRPLEMQFLDSTDKLLQEFSRKHPRRGHEARLQLLEAAASRLGGFPLSEYQRAFGIKPVKEAPTLLALAEKLVNEIAAIPIHPALALSALASQPVSHSKRRVTGAYNTDFRLAKHLAALLAGQLTSECRVIDPASGTGILLAALTLEVCGADRTKIIKWFSDSVFAVDSNPIVLRGALLALSSLTDDIDVLVRMRSRWAVMDSLLALPSDWRKMAPDGFDGVIANPPWEKVKLTRHEYLQATGSLRHYGSAVVDIAEDAYIEKHQVVARYAKELSQRFVLGDGEPDLYKAFIELYLRLLRPGGAFSALVPGGLIRSKGTQDIRTKLIKTADTFTISVLDNRARFFAIDTRFKFLAVFYKNSSVESGPKSPIRLTHVRGSETKVEELDSLRIGRAALIKMRPDLSVPEVRSRAEWALFQEISALGVRWDAVNSEWAPEFCREVDMTRDRKHFLLCPEKGSLPLIEGRMVRQHRLGARVYLGGSGRRAIWQPTPMGRSQIAPQFLLSKSSLSQRASRRSNELRAGFCDITGQTNERSMMAALIPPGVVCGNKVPTVQFPQDKSEERLLVWVGIMNSFPFDWMLRRVVTTTVNYFLLVGVPFPKVEKRGLPWQRIATAARELRKLDTSGGGDDERRRFAQLRAEIDAEVAIAYGIDAAGMELILQDFPLLDRGQPPIPQEDRSTITKDLVLDSLARRTGVDCTQWALRVDAGLNAGARPYTPSDSPKETGAANSERDQNGD